MGFSYTSISSTIAHTHTNTAGDGGALNSTTLINTAPLFGLVIALG